VRVCRVAVLSFDPSLTLFFFLRYCGKCKNHVEATKTMELWSTPDVLVLHLKRFSTTGRWGARDKIETEVSFPLDDLDLSKWTKGPDGETLYECVAVSNHMGGLGGGHYTASARNCEDGKWYYFNDCGTSEMKPSKVNSGNVYLMVYVRKGKFALPAPSDFGGSDDADNAASDAGASSGGGGGGGGSGGGGGGGDGGGGGGGGGYDHIYY